MKKLKIKYTKNKIDEMPMKPKKRRISLNNFLLPLVIVFVFWGTFLVSYTVIEANKEGVSVKQNVEQKVISSVKTVNDVWKPNIKTFEDRYVSVLVIGIDARDPIIEEDGSIKDGKTGFEELNTDSMIQVVYDMQEKNVFFISVPRDLGIEYSEEDECLKEMEDYHYRRGINHIYKLAEMNDCEEGGMAMLKKYIEKVTGFPVNYHAMITLDSFIDVIDVVGEENEKGQKGLWIDIPEAVYSYYPNDYGYYDYVHFEAGRQFLTSDELLRYSRVRMGSSDFERVRRQQVVMDALKARISSVDTYKNPNTVLELVESLKSNVVYSEFGLDEVRTFVEMYDSLGESRVYKIVLDNNLGGLNEMMTIPAYSSTGTHFESRYYLIPTVWNDPDYEDDKYREVKEYLKDYIHNPEEVKTIN